MSGSEYWNLHLIVTNRNSVSRQNNSVAGIRCCNNFLLLRLLKREFTRGLHLQRSGRAGFWALVQILAYYTLLALPGQMMTKSTFFLYFHIEKINDKSLQLAFVCMTQYFTSRHLSLCISFCAPFQVLVLKDGLASRDAPAVFCHLMDCLYASVAK